MISVGKRYRYKGKSLLHHGMTVEVLEQRKEGYRSLNKVKFLLNGSIMPNVPDSDLK